MREEYDLIMQKKSELPRSCREYIIKFIEKCEEQRVSRADNQQTDDGK